MIFDQFYFVCILSPKNGVPLLRDPVFCIGDPDLNWSSRSGCRRREASWAPRHRGCSFAGLMISGVFIAFPPGLCNSFIEYETRKPEPWYAGDPSIPTLFSAFGAHCDSLSNLEIRYILVRTIWNGRGNCDRKDRLLMWTKLQNAACCMYGSVFMISSKWVYKL